MIGPLSGYPAWSPPIARRISIPTVLETTRIPALSILPGSEGRGDDRAQTMVPGAGDRDRPSRGFGRTGGVPGSREALDHQDRPTLGGRIGRNRGVQPPRGPLLCGSGRSPAGCRGADASRGPGRRAGGWLLRDSHAAATEPDRHLLSAVDPARRPRPARDRARRLGRDAGA